MRAILPCCHFAEFWGIFQVVRLGERLRQKGRKKERALKRMSGLEVVSRSVLAEGRGEITSFPLTILVRRQRGGSGGGGGIQWAGRGAGG